MFCLNLIIYFYAVPYVWHYVPVTQWTESKFPKLLVAGSSPAGNAIKLLFPLLYIKKDCFCKGEQSFFIAFSLHFLFEML